MVQNKLIASGIHVLTLLILLLKPCVSPRCDDSGDPNFCGQNGVCGASGICQCYNKYKGMLCEIQIEAVNDNNDVITDAQMTGYAIAFILFFSLVFFLIFFFIFCFSNLKQKCLKRFNEIKAKKQKKKIQAKDDKKKDAEQQEIVQMKQIQGASKVQFEESQTPIDTQRGQTSFRHKIKNFLEIEQDNSHHNLSQSNSKMSSPNKEEQKNQNKASRLPSIYQKQLAAFAIHQGFKQNQFEQQNFDQENYNQENEAPIMIKQNIQQLDQMSTQKKMQLEMSFIRGMKRQSNSILTEENIVSQANQNAQVPQSDKTLKKLFPLDGQQQDSESQQIQFRPPLEHNQYNEPENLVVTKSVHCGLQIDQDDDERPKLPGVLDSIGSGKLSSKNSYTFKSIVKHIKDSTLEEFKQNPSSTSSRGSQKLAKIQLKLTGEGKSMISHYQKDKKDSKFIEKMFSAKNLGASGKDKKNIDFLGGGIELMQSDRKKQDEDDYFLNIENNDENGQQRSIDSVQQSYRK